MASIAVAERVTARKSPGAKGVHSERELLGVKRSVPRDDRSLTATSITKGTRMAAPVSLEEPVSEATPIKTQPSEFEKVVRRIPTLYVIAFFGVVVLCAVAIIWNTLQVNRLTLERKKMDDQIAQTEQRLIKMRAEEMQLSAPSRIRELAAQKLGMVDENGEELVVVP